MAITTRVERSFQIMEHLNAINTSWVEVFVDETTGNEVGRGPLKARGFGKTEREMFLLQFPNATAYADLAGLVDPEPVAPSEAVTEPAA